MVSGPGLSPGVTTAPVSLVDVMPSVLEIAGVDVPADLDGTSFAGAIAGIEVPRDRSIFAMEHSFHWKGGRRIEASEAVSEALSVAVIEGENWYIRGVRSEELYHMGSDLRQTRNLALRSARTADLRQVASERGAHRDAFMLAEFDPELRQQLETLGYIR
jgi:arylsulfatase A-like enzyme